MRVLLAAVLLSVTAVAQQQPNELPNGMPQPQLTPRLQVPEKAANNAEPQAAAIRTLVVPAGTHIPVALKHAISTKNAKPGDAVYAQTTFPIVIDEKVLVPAGTFVQGVVSRVERPGRVKGRGEMLFHFTTLIYPNGYTVALPGAVDQLPGSEDSRIKDDEGTVQREGEKGRDVKTVGTVAATGATIGGATSGSLKGAALGGLGGAAVGSLVTLFTRGSDLRIEAGTVVDMVLHRDIRVRPERIAAH